MKYATIENNKIVNIAVSDEALESNWILLEDGFGIGDNYVNGVFSKEILPIEVPQAITPLQAKLQLYELDLLDEVDTLVATDRKVQLYWEYALDIKRNHEVLLFMATQLGLTDEQLDDMFIQASKL